MLPLLKRIVLTGIATEPAPEVNDAWRIERAESDRIQGEILRLLGRALAIRQVDAGSCNGCELEIHA
ncbi:MAG TPA: formate hydrogenlyase, partial [Burkholderiaceae bacterium]|nr:formate hydrogenlyase [Burkholderiaceae bacterium]